MASQHVPAGEFRNGVHSSTLGPTNGHDLLGDANGTGAHTNPQTIGTGSDQLSSLFPSNDVTSNDVDLGISLFNPLNELDLVDGVTLGGVEDNNVKTSFSEKLEPVFVTGPSTNGSTAVELLALRNLAGVRIILVFEEVRPGDKRDEMALGVDDREFALLSLAQKTVGLLESDRRGASDDLSSHDRFDGSLRVLKLDVSTSNDTKQLAIRLAGLSDRNTAEAKLSLDLKDTKEG